MKTIISFILFFAIIGISPVHSQCENIEITFSTQPGSGFLGLQIYEYNETLPILTDSIQFDPVETVVTQNMLCLDPNCYYITIGLSESNWFGNEIYVTRDNIEIETSLVSYGNITYFIFNTSNQACAEFIIGCTNEMAINYNPDAVVTDYSCEFIYGCTDPTAVNYDSEAYYNDGSCEYSCVSNEITFNFPEENDFEETVIWWIYQIGNDQTLNYSQYGGSINSSDTSAYLFDYCMLDGCYVFIFSSEGEFNLDDTSLEMNINSTPTELVAIPGDPDRYFLGVNSNDCESVVLGCSDVMATNYNPDANVNDYSCEYPDWYYGCTDPIAINYSSVAFQNDWSCVYDTYSYCLADYSVYEIDEEENIVYLANESVGEDLSFFWDFGDNSTSTEEFPNHTFTEDGAYNVCLTVANDSCSNTLCNEITALGEGLIIDDEFFNTIAGFSINVIDPATVEILEITRSFDVAIYPNPMSDYFIIRLNENLQTDAELEVYNLLGTKVFSQKLLSTSKDTHVNIDLNSGFYFLKVKTGINTFTSKIEIIR